MKEAEFQNLKGLKAEWSRFRHMPNKSQMLVSMTSMSISELCPH